MFWMNILVFLSAMVEPAREFFSAMGWSPEVVISVAAVVNILMRLFGTETKLTLRGDPYGQG